MEDLSIVKTHINPTNNTSSERYLYFGLKFQLFEISVIVATIALVALFLPFAKTAVLAAIFSFAYLGAADEVHRRSRQARTVIFGLMGLTAVIFIALSARLVETISYAFDSMTDPNTSAQLKSKMSEIVLPIFKSVKTTLSKYWGQFGSSQTFENNLRDSIGQLVDTIFNFFLKGLGGLPNRVLQFAFFIFFMIFLVRRIKLTKSIEFDFLSQKNNRTIKALITVAKRSAYDSVFATLITAFAQASVLTLGSIAIGIESWPVVFMDSFIFSMIPMVGVLPVTLFCTVYAATAFGPTKAVIVALFGLMASLIDNFLRPLLISSHQANLNPVLSFFAILGSLFMFGFAGLFIGPFVLIFASTLLKKI